MAAALDGNPTTLKERSISVLTLRFAVEKFKKEIEIWRDLQIQLTKDSEVTDVEDRVRPNILGSQSKMMKNLAEEKRTRGAKTPGYVFGEDNYLSHILLG